MPYETPTTRAGSCCPLPPILSTKGPRENFKLPKLLGESGVFQRLAVGKIYKTGQTPLDERRFARLD